MTVRPDQFYRSDLNNRWALAGALTFVLLCANIVGFAIADGSGRKDYHHPTPLPAGVEQIDRETYLVPPNVTVAICRGTSNGADPIAKYRDLDRVDLKYVQCSHEQYWNDHRAESPSFTEAATRVSTNPLVKRDGKLSRGACEGLVKHKHAKRREILDTYGIPDDPDDLNEDFAGADGTLVYPLRGDNERSECTLDFDLNDKLDSITVTLWAAKPDW